MSGSGILPFKVHVPDEELQYLKQRLESARFPDQLINIAPWEDGTDLAYFKASAPWVDMNGRALREAQQPAEGMGGFCQGSTLAACTAECSQCDCGSPTFAISCGQQILSQASPSSPSS